MTAYTAEAERLAGVLRGLNVPNIKVSVYEVQTRVKSANNLHSFRVIYSTKLRDFWINYSASITEDYCIVPGNDLRCVSIHDKHFLAFETSSDTDAVVNYFVAATKCCVALLDQIKDAKCARTAWRMIIKPELMSL